MVKRNKQKNQKKARPIPKNSREIHGSSKKLKKAHVLLRESITMLIKNYRILGLILLVYGVIYLVLVLGFSVSGNASSLSLQLGKSFRGFFGGITKSFNVYGLLLNSSATSTSSNPAAGVFQGILFIILSLVLIYSFRKISNGAKLGLKDAYYNSAYPIVPFTLILLLLSVELIPMTIGLYLYSTVMNGGIAVGILEKLVWDIIVLVLVVISLYFITSSIFALFIVSLENMTPMKAIRSARNLVKRRRTIIAMKILFMPMVLIIAVSIIMLLFILILPALAGWILQILILLSIVVLYSYLYNLYRNLIDE